MYFSQKKLSSLLHYFCDENSVIKLWFNNNFNYGACSFRSPVMRRCTVVLVASGTLKEWSVPRGSADDRG